MTYRYPGGLVRRTAANTSITGASGVWDLGSQAQAVKTNTWPISGLANPVSGSLRFRSSASPFLSRTASSSPTSNQKLTISFWFKPSLYRLASEAWLFSSGTDSGRFGLYYNVNASWGLEMGSGPIYVRPSRVWRDPAAWYHIVIAVDTTQATSSNRVKWYTNGVLDDNSDSYPTQNSTLNWNANGTLNYIGRYSDGRYYDGYLAEFYSVDGQQLTPSSFGQTSPITGVWEPIKYTGTYGNNGYYLSLSDTSSIGKDFSGNGNNWTPNNISTASGSTFDLMRDVPTQYTPQGVTDVGGTVRGNYCTLNPLIYTSNQSYRTLSNSNLTTVGNSATNNGNDYSTQAIKTGKWYAEFVCKGSSGIYPQVGIISVPSAYNGSGGGQVGYRPDSCAYLADGNKKVDGGSDTSYGNSFTTNDVIGIAVDADNGAVYFSKNGTFQNSGVPTSGASKTGAADTWTGGATEFYIALAVYQSGTGWDANFGQQPFAYTPPSGFKSLCTTNLPTPTIGATVATAANKYFDINLYTGTGADQNITNSGLFQPDWVWIKSRSTASGHVLTDAVRGAGKTLYTQNTDAETTDTEQLQSFNSNGFTVGTTGDVNFSGRTYVGWQWNAGGSTVTNTTGSISAQVRASPTAGFSIATFTGNGTAGATVGHGLGVAPSMIMFKERSTGTSGLVWHTGYGTNQGQMLIDSTAAIYNPGNGLYFNSTYPSSTVVTLGTSGATNGNGSTYVLYSWAAIAGYSAFGTYVGNGIQDGPFVYTGFRPRFILAKASSNSTASTEWTIFDTTRSPSNAALLELYPNVSRAEGTDSNGMDILSNGFKPRRNSEYLNSSGYTYIYMAFAEHPFKNALAR